MALAERGLSLAPGCVEYAPISLQAAQAVFAQSHKSTLFDMLG